MKSACWAARRDWREGWTILPKPWPPLDVPKQLLVTAKQFGERRGLGPLDIRLPRAAGKTTSRNVHRSLYDIPLEHRGSLAATWGSNCPPATTCCVVVQGPLPCRATQFGHGQTVGAERSDSAPVSAAGVRGRPPPRGAAVDNWSGHRQLARFYSPSMSAAAEMQWGWVPAHVVVDLQEVGDWKRRAGAVEVLHAAAQDCDTAVLLSTFSHFLEFFVPLISDPNFKIATSAMTILEELVQRLGTDVLPYLGTLVAELGIRLGDDVPVRRGAGLGFLSYLAGSLGSMLAQAPQLPAMTSSCLIPASPLPLPPPVQLVRQTATRALGCLARTVGPQPVINALGSALVHTSWQVREGALSAEVALMQSHGSGQFDYPTAVHSFVAAAGDEQGPVQAQGLEGLVLLHSWLGPLLQGLLTTVGAPAAVRQQLVDRTCSGRGAETSPGQGMAQQQVCILVLCPGRCVGLSAVRVLTLGMALAPCSCRPGL